MKKQPVFQFLDSQGIDEFINVILELAERNFLDTMLNDITPESGETDVVTSKGILKYINQTIKIISDVKLIDLENVQNAVDDLRQRVMYDSTMFSHLKVALIFTPLSEINNPDNEIIYLQQSESIPNMWNMCVYDNDKWVVLGEGNYDLQNYYRKDNPEFENRVLDLIIQRMTFDDIKKAVFDAAMDVGMLDTRILAHLGLYTFE